MYSLWASELPYNVMECKGLGAYLCKDNTPIPVHYFNRFSSEQLKPGLPSSVTLQPAQGETEKPCGVDFILRCYVAKNAEDKIEKRNSVRLAIKKITHAPVEHTQRVSPSR